MSGAGKDIKPGFVSDHGLRGDADQRLVTEVLGWVDDHAITSVRLSFADQHGVLRGKTLISSQLPHAMENGCALTTTLLAKDTSHKTVFPVWSEDGGFDIDGMSGAGDFLMVPDPTTFQVLPWAPGTAWLLCDIYFPDGRPIPFSTRRILKHAVERLEKLGYHYQTGLEMEFHVFRMSDARLDPADAGQPGVPPDVTLLAQGFQYLTEARGDQLADVMELLRKPLQDIGLPLRTMEVEFGPSQFEFTFSPQTGIATADSVMLFRSAVKQVCRRNGLHASFMCRPRIENLFSSGWHLHQSLVDIDTGTNAFAPGSGKPLVSDVGRFFMGGLLYHGAASSLFTTPTINGYKRYQPHTLAPDHICWGADNRGGMLRLITAAGADAVRIENRAGEPAANPYLYLASQIIAGTDGMEKQREPGPPALTPYDCNADRLPRNLAEAMTCLDQSQLFRHVLGDLFVDYYLNIKRAEWQRYQGQVSEWEHREYFDLF